MMLMLAAASVARLTQAGPSPVGLLGFFLTRLEGVRAGAATSVHIAKP